MPRQKHLPGQKRISDFFQAAVAPTATSSSPSVKRGFVDEPAEEVVALPAVPPNKRQMLSVSSSGEGLPGRVNLDENAQVDGNATDLNDKTEVPDSDDELATPFSPTIPSTKAMTSPSTKTMTIPPTKAMNNVADKAVMKPSAKTRTNLPPPPITPDSEDELDVEDALMDDEYIPFEEDEQLQDVDIQVEPIVHPLQKQRIPSSELNAARYVQQYNEAHPVDEDDEDVQRFDSNFSLLIKAFCEWAEESSKNWYTKPRQEREMVMSFYSLFRRTATKSDNLAQICLAGMPRQARKVLGRAELKAADLLDLPTVPDECRHRLAYMDIATQLPEDQLCRVANRRLSRRLYKAAKPSANLKEALKISLYVGSSTRIEGSRARMKEHEDASNRYMPAFSMHYRETSKSDVLCNFRLLGVWQNPYADNSFDGQDVSRWIAPMVEGLMMVYLGLYTEKNIAKSHPEIFTPTSFVLKNRIRRGINLPDFGSVSLNRAWSLCQGVRGGTKTVKICANPECRRPREISEDTIPGTKPCDSFKSLVTEDLLSPLYCARCYRHTLKYGSMRTREGLSTGRWRHEFDLESVNKAWINQGHERKCHNINCGVAIHPDANLYGAENGIRCYRCYKYALLYRKEYSPRNKDEEEVGFCLLCDREDVSILTWTKVDLVKDPDLPSKLCGDCYSKRCSFLQDDIPSDSQPTTVKCCANAACWDPHRVGRLENLVENKNEHLWRCIRCDYCHEIGVDAFDKNKPPENLPKPPSGPIASHRFNCTKCVDCARYISYNEWQSVDGGYRCGLCVGAKCSDCNVDPAVAYLVNPSSDESRCLTCYNQHAMGRTDGKAEKRGAWKRVTPDRKCSNPNCDVSATDGSNRNLWRFHPDHPADEDHMLCKRCHQFFVNHKQDWVPNFKCHNDGCDVAGADVKWYTHPDGTKRCHPCHNFYAKRGIERNLKPVCRNFSGCGHDYTTYTKPRGFCSDDQGNMRCKPCYEYWIKHGKSRDRYDPK